MRSVLVFLIFLWFALNVTRLGNNLISVYTEERSWIYLNDFKKKELLLGKSHVIWSYVLANTKENSNIAVYISDPNLFPGADYLSLYYLYPRRIKFINNINTAKLKKNNFTHLVTIYKGKKDKITYELIKI